ncbi:hypothetical protein [Streptomyces platensis]|uniref:hypothetical protein n=1 Tax=Streptomyces platensis TaxID=58346 RepID=UPI0033295213
MAAIDPVLPAGNRKLAEALRTLRPMLPPSLDTYTAIAAQAAMDCGSERLSKTTISRYFSGKLIAPGWFICWLHTATRPRQHTGDLAPPLEELLTLQRSANNPTDCSGCNRLTKELGRSEADRLTAMSRRWRLERTLAACLDSSRRAGSGAGSQDRPASRRGPLNTLPVPYYRADRHNEVNDIRAAENVTMQVSALASEQKHHEATATLSNAGVALPPEELVAVVVGLRSRQVRDEAETLLQMYARDQPADNVIRLACELLKYELISDAETLLRAAVK